MKVEVLEVKREPLTKKAYRATCYYGGYEITFISQKHKVVPIVKEKIGSRYWDGYVPDYIYNPMKKTAYAVFFPKKKKKSNKKLP